MLDPADPRSSAARLFAKWLAPLPPDGTVLILGHFDADGLSAAATLSRALTASGRAAPIRLVGKGETPWDDSLRAQLAAHPPAGLIVTDLGVREGAVLPGTPTLLIDHHVPTGTPGDALVISGNRLDPEPTSALLAYWCAAAVTNPDALLWLAALGLIGDMAREDAFPELAEAQRRYGKTHLKNAVSLINAPRRTAAADASAPLTLLIKCDSPKELLSGIHAETAALHAAKAEVAAAMEEAKRAPPKVRGDIALIRLHSPCQIHPLIAQQWRGRLKDKIVIAANPGYRPGWIHFAARTATGADLIAFFAEHRPPGATSHYGSGHRQASGGALRPDGWNAFVESIGFPDEVLPSESAA
jgi:single-stranded-DNA-specific exonuclease